MSDWNIINAEWTCPFCRERQNGEIRFEYGSMISGEYHVGDCVSWNSDIGYWGHKRLANDSGHVPGEVSCKNEWSIKWLRSIGALRQGQVFVQWPTDKEPPLERRKMIGCPERMYLLVRIENNRIREVGFPKDSEMWDAQW